MMPPGPNCGGVVQPYRAAKAYTPMPFKLPLKILKCDPVLTQCQTVIMQPRSSMQKNTVRKLVQFATAFVQ